MSVTEITNRQEFEETIREDQIAEDELASRLENEDQEGAA